MVIYEWTCETVAAIDSAEYGIGDVVDAIRFDTAAELQHWVCNEEPEDGCEFRPVLVRLQNGWHSWAYMQGNGSLPAMFYDSNGNDVARVPSRLIAQWEAERYKAH